MSNRKKVPISSELKNALDFFSRVCSDYTFHYNEVNRLDRETQDYLHELELGDINNRRRTATSLTHCRRDRRANLDNVEILQPLVDLLNAKETQALLRKFSEALGKVRREEEKHVFRAYIPKEVSPDKLTLRTLGGTNGQSS